MTLHQIKIEIDDNLSDVEREELIKWLQLHAMERKSRDEYIQRQHVKLTINQKPWWSHGGI